MNKLLKDIRGISLVELVVTIAIVAIISTTIGTFFIVFTKSYENSKNNIDIQYEAQVVLNEMTNIAMRSQGITRLIKDKKNVIHFKTPITNPSAITLKEKNTVHTFTYNNVEQVIYYNNTQNTTKHIFAKDISNFTVFPNSGQTYSNSDTIEIKFVLNKGDTNLNVSTIVKFRNRTKGED
jgi:Tfp pilus assembly protein PilW